MKQLKHYLFVCMAAVLCLSIVSCGDDEGGTPEPDLDDDSSISSFSFEELTPSVTAEITGTDIVATVDYTVDVTSLVPTIAIPATASITPASGEAQNFEEPVVYTVTAEDGTTTEYTATVTVEDRPVLAATANWELTLKNGGLPSWFTANNDRDIAAHGDYVYVHNNNDKIRVLSSADGTDVTAGAEGFIDGKENFASGNVFLMNVATDADGVIIGSNLRKGDDTNPWNVYKWNDKDASQELLFSYTPATGDALADNIAVVGSVTGDGYIYAPGDGFFGESNKVFKFEITDGTVDDTPTEITIEGVDQLGNGNDVYPVSAEADANLILAGTSVGISEYTSTGELVGKLPEELNEGETAWLFTFALDVIPFEISGRKVIAATATDFTDNEATSGALFLIDYTDGWENITAGHIINVPFTPEGNIDTNFNGTGGVDVVVNEDVATVYAIITNFGVASFDVSFE